MNVTLEGLGRALKNEERRIDRVSNEVIKTGTEGLKGELRQMTRSALGSRIAFAWQSNLYTQDNAGFVYTKAPQIIDLNMRGGTIVPSGGSQYFAIPTDNVPRRRGGRGGKARMNPFEVEAHFNQDLIFRPSRSGKALLAFIDSGARRKRGSRGKKQVRRAAIQKLLHMFTFVRNYTAQKTIDPDAAFRRWSNTTRQKLQKEFS